MHAKGMILTMAARSVEQSIKAIRTIIETIRKLRVPVPEDPEISLRSILANAYIPWPLCQP
ncbi:MAG: hypothetical protein ACOC3C_04545 [Candidatus Thorarchaeota archaeon]